MYNIMLLGNGGREHALAWKITQSEKCETLYVAPGNPGTSKIATNVALDPMDFEALGEWILAHNIHFLVVGPELPLVGGIADYFAQDARFGNLVVIGPGKKGAMLEGSKDFAKQFMQRHQIPTASYRTFTADQWEEGLDYIEGFEGKVVLKADGLAAGKGVVILEDKEEAKSVFREMLGGKFGQAGERVVIESFLEGIEFSMFVLTDGNHYQILPAAKDYKQIGEGNTGPNTGGMGAVSPVPFLDEALYQKVEKRIVIPTLQGLRQEGIPYMGFVFLGLINVGGDPFVIEYNCRLGDPETEAILPRIENDIVEWFEALGNGNLSEYPCLINSEFATTVVLVSGGYPEAYAKGFGIEGLENVEDCLVFHAGTRLDKHQLLTHGGRVIAFTAMDTTLKGALSKTLEAAKTVDFEGKYYRRDIGLDLLEE
jgi:phosphoribosylamine---glycine ligase